MCAIILWIIVKDIALAQATGGGSSNLTNPLATSSSSFLDQSTLLQMTTSSTPSPTVLTLSHTERIVVLIYLALTMTVSVVGNGAVISAVIWYPDLQRGTYYLITLYCANALALTLLYHPFALIYVISNEYIMGHVWCQVQAVLLATLFLSSLHIMAIIAYERFYYVDNPIEHTQTFSEWRIGSTVVMIYVVAGLISFVMQYIYGARYDEAHLSCTIYDSYTLIFMGGCVYYIPSVLLQMYSHAEILRLTLKQKQQINTILVMLNEHRRSLRRKLNTTRSIFVVSCFISLSWLPYICVRSYARFHGWSIDSADRPARIIFGTYLFLHTASPFGVPVLFTCWNNLLRLAIGKLYCQQDVSLAPYNSALTTPDESHIEIYALYPNSVATISTTDSNSRLSS